MPRHSEDPVHHVITFRVNSEEKKALEALAKNTANSVSNYMRKNLQFIIEDSHESSRSDHLK